jgi:hypothetical protein
MQTEAQKRAQAKYNASEKGKAAIANKRANQNTKRQAASAARPPKPPKQKKPRNPKPRKLKHGPITPAPPDPLLDVLFRYDRFSNPNPSAATEAQGHYGSLPTDIERLICAYGPISERAKRGLRIILPRIPFGAQSMLTAKIRERGEPVNDGLTLPQLYRKAFEETSLEKRRKENTELFGEETAKKMFEYDRNELEEEYIFETLRALLFNAESNQVNAEKLKGES